MNYSTWAEWYDVIYSLAPAGEVDFYVRLAKHAARAHPEPVEARPARVLELGIGTGRIALPTVLAGANVTGIDLYAPMLDRAAAKARDSALTVLRTTCKLQAGADTSTASYAAHATHPATRRASTSSRWRVAHHQGVGPATLELIQADMRTLDLGRMFDLVTIPSNTLLLAASRTDQLATLKRATAHVASGGRLAFDIFNPTSELLSSRSEGPFLWGETVNPAGGRRCRIFAINRFDTRRQLNRGTQIVEELDHRGRAARRVELDILVRYLHPSEAHLLIERAGLRALEMAGDFDRSPFAESSPRMVFMCERR